MRHSLHARIVVLAAGAMALAAAVAAPLVVAAPASATEYPTWADVQKAKGNEDATKVEIGRVQTALQSAQDDAAAKSQAALTAAGAASDAEAELATATQTATGLQAQADSAAKTADRAQQRAGQLAANLYRDGGASGSMTSRIASSTDPDSLLYQLGTLDQLSGTWAGVMEQAQVSQKTADSLHAQATRAEGARKSLAVAAEKKSQAAQAASDTAQAAVESTQQHSDELYSQLASLKNTTADVEKNYELGVQVAAQKAAVQRANELAAEKARNASTSTSGSSGSSGSGSSGSGGGATTGGTSYPSTSGVAVDPTAAKAYARSALGSYGWGDDQYSCLVSLWTMESGWRANALNPSSGAYGIPQALPATKMAAAGADWRTNQNTQINWGLAYIKSAYGSPCGAWNHEMSVNPHWY